MSINKKVCHVFELLFVFLVIGLMSLGSIEALEYIRKFDKYTHILLALTFISSGFAWGGYHRAVKEEELEDDK